MLPTPCVFLIGSRGHWRSRTQTLEPGAVKEVAFYIIYFDLFQKNKETLWSLAKTGQYCGGR